MEVLERQIATAEPISASERLPVIAVETAAGAAAYVVRDVAARLAAMRATRCAGADEITVGGRNCKSDAAGPEVLVTRSKHEILAASQQPASA